MLAMKAERGLWSSWNELWASLPLQWRMKLRSVLIRMPWPEESEDLPLALLMYLLPSFPLSDLLHSGFQEVVQAWWEPVFSKFWLLSALSLFSPVPASDSGLYCPCFLHLSLPYFCFTHIHFFLGLVSY